MAKTYIPKPIANPALILNAMPYSLLKILNENFAPMIAPNYTSTKLIKSVNKICATYPKLKKSMKKNSCSLACLNYNLKENFYGKDTQGQKKKHKVTFTIHTQNISNT